MIILYNILISVLFILISPYIFLKLLIPETRSEWIERLGFWKYQPDSTPGKNIWIHCASVGETKLAGLLIQKLNASYSGKLKFFLSVITPAGKKFASEQKLPVEKLFYLPFDLPFLIKKTVKSIKPDLLILVETELWPNLIHSCSKSAKLKILIVNSRISDKSINSYLLFKWFFKHVLNKVELFLVREHIDRKRLLSLGVPENKIHITGNMKYDLTGNTLFSAQEISKIKSELFLPPAVKLFTAGSIRAGEEKFVLSGYLKLKSIIPDLKLIFAPRHMNRINFIKDLLNTNRLKFACKSQLSEFSGDYDVCILDTFGELLKIYAISCVCFVGGTLIPVGGQNMLEPVMVNKLPLFGQYTGSFKEPAELLKSAGIGIEIKSIDELVEKSVYLITNPEFIKEKIPVCSKIIEQMKGATDRNISIITRYL